LLRTYIGLSDSVFILKSSQDTF